MDPDLKEEESQMKRKVKRCPRQRQRPQERLRDERVWHVLRLRKNRAQLKWRDHREERYNIKLGRSYLLVGPLSEKEMAPRSSLPLLQKKGFKDVLTLIILVRVQSPPSAFRFVLC